MSARPETTLDIGFRKLRDYGGDAVLSDAEANAILDFVDELGSAILHVVNDSPGTPDSVKTFLRAALSGADKSAGWSTGR